MRARVDEIKAEIAERLGEEKIRLVGLDLDDANGILKDMSRSVLYMNSWNSIAGTLANTNLAFPVGKPGFFAGPVSFDASGKPASPPYALFLVLAGIARRRRQV